MKPLELATPQLPPERPERSLTPVGDEFQLAEAMARTQRMLSETASWLYVEHVYPHMRSVPSTEYIRGCEPCEGWAAAKAFLDE